MKKYLKQLGLVSIFLFSLVLLAPTAFAQGEAVEEVPVPTLFEEMVEVTNVEVETQEAQVETPEAAQEIKKPKSAFGWFMRDVKERLSLLVTINPLKKAQKQIAFAEQRVQAAKELAEANPEDEKIQKRVQKEVDRAEKLLNRVEAKKEKWLAGDKDKVNKLVERISKGEKIRQRHLDKIEENLPEDKKEKFQEKREKILEKQKSLLQKIEESDLPEEVKEHVLSAKQKNLERHQELKEFLEEKKEILSQENSEERIEKLKELHQDRKVILEKQREERKEDREELKEIIKENPEAKKVLKQLEQKREDGLERRKENIKERKAEIKEGDQRPKQILKDKVLRKRPGAIKQ